MVVVFFKMFIGIVVLGGFEVVGLDCLIDVVGFWCLLMMCSYVLYMGNVVEF